MLPTLVSYQAAMHAVYEGQTHTLDHPLEFFAFTSSPLFQVRVVLGMGQSLRYYREKQ